MRYVTVVGTAFAVAVVAIACGGSSVTSPSPRFVVGTTGNFRTITDALKVAQSGDVVQVLPGTYSERVIVTTPGVRLQAEGAVLDGAGVGGTGIGIEIANVPNVEISGFVIRNFERGIVFDRASDGVLRNNEVLNSLSKTGPPFVVGTTLFEGIALLGSRNIEVAGNFSHENGCAGIMLAGGSAGNRLHGNRFAGNGVQIGTTG